MPGQGGIWGARMPVPDHCCADCRFRYSAPVQARAVAKALLSWFHQHARDLPWRRTGDPYAVWVSEIMLQQTQVKTVIPYFERWMQELPNVRALAKVSPDKLHKLWEGLGYYTRVRNMHRAAKQIVEQFDAQFPKFFDDILALPGIGRYTAGAICSIAYGQPTPVLDGNVIRVLARVYCLGGDPREKSVNDQLWALASELVEAACKNGTSASPRSSKTPRVSAPSALNQALMELGALICTPKDPDCTRCPVATLCLACRRALVASYPQLAKRAPAIQRRFLAFVVQDQDRLLVRQRPAGVVNAHLWEFPNLEVTGTSEKLSSAAKLAVGAPVGQLQQLCVIKHSITRYRMTLEAFQAVLKTTCINLAATAGQWVPTAQVHALAFSSAHKRVLEQWHGRSAPKLRR